MGACLAMLGRKRGTWSGRSAPYLTVSLLVTALDSLVGGDTEWECTVLGGVLENVIGGVIGAATKYHSNVSNRCTQNH